MNRINLIVAAVASLSISGCSALGLPPPETTLIRPSSPRVESHPAEASATTKATPTPKPIPPIPAASSYKCREATPIEKMKTSDNYSGEITKFAAIDLGEGWSLIAYTVKDDKDPRVELTNGVRLVHAPDDGVWEAYPIAFAEPKRALDAAIACLK